MPAPVTPAHDLEVTAPAGHEEIAPLGEGLSVEKMPAHWLMARMGKRVLRPGGLETTRWLLDRLRIAAEDDVVEFAPGLGITAREILARGPHTYRGVERDAAAVVHASRRIAGGADARVVRGDATRVPLPGESASVVVGEAMLSMQPPARKSAIIAEAARLLRPGGRYAIHELAAAPDDLDAATVQRIQDDLSREIHVGVRIGTVAEWRGWLEDAGFEVEAVNTAPMHLLEPARFVRDEGFLRTLRFLFNVIRNPAAARRLRRLRRAFHTHASHLCAIAIVARRRTIGGRER